MWTIVQFLGSPEEIKLLDIIPISWINNSVCFYPPEKLKDKISLLSAIQASSTEDWNIFEIQALKEQIDTYSKARDIVKDILKYGTLWSTVSESEIYPRQHFTRTAKLKNKKRKIIFLEEVSSDEEKLKQHTSTADLMDKLLGSPSILGNNILCDKENASKDGEQISSVENRSSELKNSKHVENCRSSPQDRQSYNLQKESVLISPSNYDENVLNGSLSIKEEDDSCQNGFQSIRTMIAQEMKGFTDKLNLINDKMDAYFNQIQSSQMQIRRDLDEIRKKSTADVCVLLDDLPFLPVKSLVEFDQLEEIFSKKENKQAINNHFKGYRGAGRTEYITNILRSMISNEVAVKFNWHGKANPHVHDTNVPNKMPFRKTNFWRCIKDYFTNSSLPEMKSIQISNVEGKAKYWLQQAQNRIKSKNQTREKRESLDLQLGL